MIHIKDAYYFSHDSNARHDPEICEMISMYGMEGYGWFWVIIEMLRDQEGYKLKLYKRNALAMQMQCTPDASEKYINDCINEFGLFTSDGEYFWSESLIRRMKNREEVSNKRRQAALSRWDKGNNANAMQVQCKPDALKESKVNKSKVKEKKVYYSENVCMTEREYQKLVTDHGEPFTKECIKILDNYIPNKPGKPYKDHYRVILSWVIERAEERLSKVVKFNGTSGTTPKTEYGTVL